VLTFHIIRFNVKKFYVLHAECVCVFIWYTEQTGTAVAQWLRYCATNQKVAGSIPDGVMEFFIDINPSDRTMALGSTQPLKEMSTQEYFLGVNVTGAYG
jgi:membrane-bound lytic murein transglycosylase B